LHDPGEHPHIHHRKSPLVRALIKLGVLVLLVAGAFAAVRFTPLRDYLEKERLTALLEQLRHAWWSPLALLGLYAVTAPAGLPMTPLIVAGGIVFGAWWGALLNLFGTFIGATISFLLGRALGHDVILHLAGDRLRKVERLLHRHGFWSLVRVRFLPIPFALVNYGAAFAGVRLPAFLTASAIGLAPAMLSFTYFSAAIANAAAGERAAVVRNMILSACALIALSLIPTTVSRLRRRRRYRDLLARRAQRSPDSPPPRRGAP
jgi:uncharacterized membrane protein YdjX (TVP38/TMEM64 family)